MKPTKATTSANIAIGCIGLFFTMCIVTGVVNGLLRIPIVDRYVTQFNHPELAQSKRMIEWNYDDTVNCRLSNDPSRVVCTTTKKCDSEHVLYPTSKLKISDDCSYLYKSCMPATEANSVRVRNPFTGTCEAQPYSDTPYDGMLSTRYECE